MMLAADTRLTRRAAKATLAKRMLKRYKECR